MKNNLCLLAFIAIWSLIGCGNKATGITNLAMLAGGKTFAVPTGTVADQFVYRRFPDAKIEYYNSVLDCALAVLGGKADAAVYDEPILKNIAAKNEGLIVLPELLQGDNYGFAVQIDNIPLKTAIDETLAELKSNGTYDDMMKRWFPVKGAPAPMPGIDLSGGNGILRFGTAAVTEPMSFHDANRNIVGFDVEFAARVALKLGKRIEITDMEFGAMLPALISGKVDMIGAGLSITEERAKKVLFSESYYPSGIAAVVKGNAPAPASLAGRKMKTVDDISGKTIGVLLGSVHDTYATRTYPKAKILHYQSLSDLLIALDSGKIDVAYYDQASVPEMLKVNPDLGILARDVFSVPIGAGFNRDNDTLREQFNAFLKEIRSNGVYQDMVTRWMEKGIMDMPVIESTKTNGVLRAGVVNDLGMPFGLVRDGRLIGFDIELSSRFAAYTGREYVPVPLQFGSLIASISTNKIDIITASMFITEERSKMIDFADPYFESGVSLIARKDAMDPSVAGAAGGPASRKPFLKRVSDSFYSNIILEKRYQLILDGLLVTIIISIFAAGLGTMLGGLICFMNMSSRKILSVTARLYISLLRGTPMLVLLMIIYYIVFASVNINPVLVSILAFGLNFGAYVSEMFRTSIQSIDKGQKEAGIACGFTKIQTFIHIIAPQALRHLLPVYKGEFISLVKMTSIVGYVAVQDLTKASDIIRSRTFDAFFPLIMAAVIYLMIAWLLTRALGYIEISVAPKRKRMIKELEAGR
ncbi:MAG: ABC transporter permease subunit [Deltaproteobacteria bacterium]|nr:ABC transporter permease subunit [Deltaproteobacteria bacterium]